MAGWPLPRRRNAKGKETVMKERLVTLFGYLLAAAVSLTALVAVAELSEGSVHAEVDSAF